MIKLFNLFKYGFITIFTSPIWILFFIYSILKCLVLFIYNLFKNIILFFCGKEIFFTKEDKAIEILKVKESEDLEKKKLEALNDAEQLTN